MNWAMIAIAAIGGGAEEPPIQPPAIVVVVETAQPPVPSTTAPTTTPERPGYWYDWTVGVWYPIEPLWEPSLDDLGPPLDGEACLPDVRFPGYGTGSVSLLPCNPNL